MTATTTIREEAVRWAFFHDLFRNPTLEQWDWLHSDAVRQAWSVLSNEYLESDSHQMPLPDTFEQFHEEYIAAYEVGAPSPPCPLIESHWNKHDTTPRILHENMMFYRQFGLELRSTANETADHLRHQLEFVNHLCILSDRYVEDSQTSQITLAKKDFIKRHLLSWIPPAAAAFEKECADWWASDWINLLNAHVTNYSTVQT